MHEPARESMSEAARERFERAFVATAYLLGRRGLDLLDGLPAPCARAAALARELEAGARGERARLLAVELGRLAQASSPWRWG